MLEELEENAEQELKRIDHLIYVSLKYTRTTDVIKIIIRKLITVHDFAILELLEHLRIKPAKVAMVRAKQLLKKVRKLKPYIDFYLFLRKIDRSPYSKKEEYRKNVTLITPFERVNVPLLYEYFERTKEFVNFIKEYTKRKRKR